MHRIDSFILCIPFILSKIVVPHGLACVTNRLDVASS